MTVDSAVDAVKQARKRKIPAIIANNAESADQHRSKRKIELLAQEDHDEEMAELEEENGVAAADEAGDTEIIEQADEELITGKSFNMKKFREKLRDGDFIFGERFPPNPPA